MQHRCLRVVFLGKGVVDRAQHHRDALAIQVCRPVQHRRRRCRRGGRCCSRSGARKQHLRVAEIGRGKIDRLRAFGRGGHAGPDQVDLAGNERGDQRHEFHVDELDRPLEPRSQPSREFPVVAGHAAALRETQGLARGGHAYAERRATRRHRNLDFPIGRVVRLDPPAAHIGQRAISAKRGNDPVDGREQLRVALAQRHRGLFLIELLGQHLQAGGFLDHLVGGGEGRDDGIEMAGLDGCHGVHDVVETLHISRRKAPPGDGLTEGPRHHPDTGFCRVLQDVDLQGRARAYGRSQPPQQRHCD